MKDQMFTVKNKTLRINSLCGKTILLQFENIIWVSLMTEKKRKKCLLNIYCLNKEPDIDCPVDIEEGLEVVNAIDNYINREEIKCKTN